MTRLTIALISASLTLAAAVTAAEEATGPHYTRARELYDLGPEKAAEIIAELDLELRDNPESLKALSLKANTQIGTGEYAAAMATLDRFDEITKKQNTISANGVYLRARCLYFMGELAPARKLLEAHWAFFEGSNLKPKYDSLLEAIRKDSK